MAEIQRRRTSPNGVFGIKIHYPHIQQHGGFDTLTACFPNAYYILLSRKDVLKQAVSLSIARQTGEWISGQKPVNDNPQYDAAHINECLRQTVLNNSSWRYTLAANGCRYIEMDFDDVLHDLVLSINTISRFIGIEIDASEIPNEPVTTKQSSGADVRLAFADVPPEKLVITEVPGLRKVPSRDARFTPTTDVERKPDGTVAVTLHLPGCIFPAYRNDGKPSTVKVLDREHPLAAGLPDVFTLDRTEMYDEPYHVPEPDAVVCEETWEAGERFRSVMVWQVGEGRVVYIRPGHETFPIWKDDHMLRLLENAVRWRRQEP
jgi:hypothetical protein